MEYLKHQSCKMVPMEATWLCMAASLGHFWAAEGSKEALEMAPATNLQSSAGAGRVQGGDRDGAWRVQGGCKEGARRVQGGCKEGASIARKEIWSREVPLEEYFDIYTLSKKKRHLSFNISKTPLAKGPANCRHQACSCVYCISLVSSVRCALSV